MHCALPRFPDYASVTEDTTEDKDRFRELSKTYTPAELLQTISAREIVAPFGPHGCLGDVYWFNFFGRVYVDFIGRDRLVSAGWTRVEEVGDGLACYATEKIDDPCLRQTRTKILNRLEEFFWTPGCRREEKKIPTFDFSEQLDAQVVGQKGIQITVMG
jgi:hypothetical protein